MSDTQIVEQRLRSFIDAPDDADWQDVLRRAGEAPTRAPVFARRRMVLAFAACVVVAAPAVVFSGLLGSSHTPAGQRHVPPASRGGRPPGFVPMSLNFTREGQAITSIGVTVNSPTRDATMQLQVLRSDASLPLQAMQDQTDRQVVFQEQVPMTNIESPATGPLGVVALSTWSGTLSPSDWDGGCQNMLYTVAAVVVPSGSSFANPTSVSGSQTTEARWFTCSSG